MKNKHIVRLMNYNNLKLIIFDIYNTYFYRIYQTKNLFSIKLKKKSIFDIFKIFHCCFLFEYLNFTYLIIKYNV